MRNRRERILKLSCLLLGTALALQLARFILAGDPAKGLVIPTLPSLPPELEAQTTKVTNAPVAKSTNAPGSQVSAKPNTNSSAPADNSNSVPVAEMKKPAPAGQALSSPETNFSSAKEVSSSRSNSVADSSVNAKPSGSGETNGTIVAKSAVTSTNLPDALARAGKGTNTTDTVAGLKTGTNTNVSISGRPNALPPGRMAMGGKPPELPAQIKERVDRITQGEILGQIIRPMPMALLGIAGPHAFLRSPDGQMGMIKEGEKLGNLKLLRIGNNRVLVEDEGEKKELSIFAGLGSETLMPAKEPPAKDKKPNEPTIKPP
jgi:hypothetical protein